MIINLNILRIKKENYIEEVFTVSPEIPYCFDNKRSIYYKLRTERNKNSIHNLGYKLIDVNYYDKFTSYIFEFDETKPIPEINENIIINYNPVLGKKLCNKCNNLIKGICNLKGFKVNKKSFYKCYYWMENVFN